MPFGVRNTVTPALPCGDMPVEVEFEEYEEDIPHSCSMPSTTKAAAASHPAPAATDDGGFCYPFAVNVRNTFVDCAPRTTSFDEFFQERQVRSCPASCVHEVPGSEKKEAPSGYGDKDAEALPPSSRTTAAGSSSSAGSVGGDFVELSPRSRDTEGCGHEKNFKSALDLFREMPQANTMTYNSIIDACVKGGDLSTAEQLLREISAPTSSLEPDLVTFSTLLKGYCDVGDLDKALQVAEGIKARGLRCDEQVYNLLMECCVKANDVTVGVGLFEEMLRQGMQPSSVTHGILARLYQRAGYGEDASEAVTQLYHHHGIDRPGHWNYNTRSPEAPQINDPSAWSHAPQMSHSRTGSMTSQPERNETCWSGWNESQPGNGYDNFADASLWNESQSYCGFDNYADPSASSTPLSSPPQHTGCAPYAPHDGIHGGSPPPPMGYDAYGTQLQSNIAGSPCIAQQVAQLPQHVAQQMAQQGMEQQSAAPQWQASNSNMPGALRRVLSLNSAINLGAKDLASMPEETPEVTPEADAPSAPMPSLGSAAHEAGRCKPCAFMHTKGCENGLDCPFCHLCEPGEKKKRRKEKLETRRSMRQLRQALTTGFGFANSSSV